MSPSLSASVATSSSSLPRVIPTLYNGYSSTHYLELLHHYYHHPHHLELLVKFEGHSDDVSSTLKTLKQLSAVEELSVVSERTSPSKGELIR